MMKLTLWDPFKGMATYRRDLNRLFEEPFGWVFRYRCNGRADAGPELAAEPVAEPHQHFPRCNAIGTVKPCREWGRHIGVTLNLSLGGTGEFGMAAR